MDYLIPQALTSHVPPLERRYDGAVAYNGDFPDWSEATAWLVIAVR